MPDLQAVCDVDDCGALVDATTVEAHMDAHGMLLPGDWRLKAWPDGYSVLLDPTEQLSRR